MGKGRPLTEFEKNLREEIFKRDNHIENSVKYAIDRGDDYGVLKNTPRWRRDAIEKYKNEHKTSIFDDDGNEVGKISYEARRAIRKNKISDYKPQNDDEKKVFDYLKNRRAESEKSASELKKKTSNELFSLKNNKNGLDGIKPDVVNLHDGAAVKNEYSRTESEAKKYKPDDNEIFEISVSPSRTVKLKYGIKNKIDDIAGENGIASDLKAKRIDEAIEKLNLSESELSDARSYAGIKKLEIATASNGKNSFIKEISQPIVKFLMGTRDTAEGAAKFLKNGGKLNGDYSEEYANIEKYYEEHPDELGNDLFDTYKGGMSNPKGDYLRNTAVDKMLEAYNDTTKASQFIGDAGFRSAGQMMGASALAYGSGAAEAASGATALIKNAADGTKAAKVISKAASIAPKISEVGGNGNVSRVANTAIKKVNSLSVGKALKFLNPFDNPTTVIMGMNAAQDKYDALKKMGYDDDTSKKNALFSGYVSAITEKMGYDGKPESFLFNRNGKPIAGSATASKSKNAKKLIKDYLTANVSEGVEEIYNTVFERMGDYLSKVGYVDENGHLKQRKVFGNEGIFDVKDMGENFLGGFVGGAVMGSVGVLSNIASYDTKTVHEYADEVKKQVSKSNELVEKYAKESGMEAVILPDEPDWKKASVNEINNYYEKAVDAHLNILFNENVIKSDSEKLDGAEKLIATPDDSTSAYADDEQTHDASENLAEGNAGVSVQQLESGVKKLTDNLTAEYKSSYIKNIPNYQTVYDENLRLSSTPGKVVDEQFVRTYALSYAEGLRQNNSKAYKKLSAVSDDVGGMLSDYILRNKTPQGIETNEDMSALYRTAGGLKRIINRAANAVMSANNQIYGKSDTLTEAANEISRGNYSVVKYENAGDISLSKVGEYYEAYGTDAVKLKNLIPVSTHYTERNRSKTLVAAIPAGNINEYIDTLKLSANAYSAGGREFISLTANTADTTNVSGTDERKTDAYESNSNIEVSENEISVSSKPSAQQVSEIAFVISRNPSIPLILNGNEKLGETVLFYAEEEDTSRERIENDINSYYDGVMPEIGTKIPNEYDEDMKFSVDGDGYSKQLVTDFETAVKDIMTISDYSARVNAEARTAVRILENTPSVILDNIEGSVNLPIVINFTKMYLAARKNGVIKGNYHNLGSDILMKLPQMISDPDMILQLGNGRLNLLSKAKTENGNNAVVSIELNSSKDIEGKNKNYNVVITLFSANDNYVRNLINKDGTEIKYAKEDLSQVNPRLYNRPATFNDKSSIDNISQNDNIVNSSIRKNSGNDTDMKFYVAENTDGYSAKEIENWKDSKNIVVYNNEAQFKQFVDEVLDNKKPDRKMYFGKVSENAAKNIFEKTGVDVSGYNISLKGYEIRKILLNSHGNAKSESMRGQAAINVSDLLKIPEIITNPDYIGLSDKLYNGNKVIEFRKEFNGRTVVISYVSGKHHDLQIQTMYKNIKRNLSELPSEDNSLSHTSKTRLGTVSSIDNISQNDDVVNSSIRKNAENDTDMKFSVDGDGYSHVYNVEKADKGYLNYSNTDIETAIENIRNGNTNEIPSEIEVARLNPKTVEKINDVVGFDISDYKCKIEKDTLLHIEKRHGLNGKQDQSLADPKDVARMGYVINNADNVSLLKDGNGDRVVSKKYNDRNNTPCPILMISKRIDGTYCVSQVVPDSKKKTVWVTSARIQKADVGSQVPNTVKGQQLTSETPLVSSSALDNTNISQNNDVVNSSIRENTENDTDIKFSIDGDFAAKYDRWVENGGNYRQTLNVGRTSETLKSIGVPDKKITWDTAKIAKIKEKHNVDDNIIKQVPYILEEPIVIMKSLQKSSRITLCGEVYDLNNKPVMAILELNPTNAKGDILLDEIKLVSAYGKDNLQNLINKSEILYVEPNKKRTNDWLTQNRLQLPLGQTNHRYNTNISQNNDVVNSNIRKNSGNDTENAKFSQDNSLDGGGGISYNDDINIPYRESVQLREYIIAENNRDGSELKPFDKKEIGDNFYVWKNNSKTDYDVVMQIEIDGNEDIIDLIRKELDNGKTHRIDDGTKRLDEIVAGVRDRRRGDNSDNARNTAELSNGNDDRLYPRQSSDDDGIKFARESNRNQQNTEVENYGRDDILNGDDRRTSGKSEGERGSGFREIAGNAERNAGEEQSGASTRRIYARDVKAAGGVERRTDRGVEADFVKPEYYNDEMRRIATENDERGVVTHFILGNGRAIKYGTNFRGAVRGNEVYIQADHGKYSPSQINRHEIIHRNYSTNTVLELKNRILSRLTNKQINDISERLYRDYAQKRRSFDEIFEEFVCDVLADMNDYAEMFSTETREYWTAEEQERKGYSPSTYRESIDAGGKNAAENKIEPLAWNSDKKSVHPINAFGSNNNNISQNDSVVNNSSANAEFSNQVDSWKDGSMDKNEVFNLGNTPDVLKNIGADGLPIIMTQKVMNKITGGKHDIDLSEIKRLPQSIAEPIMIFKSATTPNAYVILTELSDKNGNSVVAALHLNRMQRHIAVNRIASVYGKENIENFVDRQAKAGNMIFADKNKSQQWSQSRGLQLPKLADTIADNTNISQNDNIVNSNIRENSRNDTDIRFSADENTDVNVSGDEDMSYLSEPVKNIKNDIREVRLRAEASHGKVFDRKDINEVCDSILNNINTGAVRGIEIKSKKDRTVMSVLVNRVLNSAGVDAKRKHTRALARFIAQNATAYDSKSLSAADGVDYESDKAVITSYIKHGVKLSPDAKEAVISVVGESSAKGYISMMSNENALGIDAVYDELRLVMPEYFTEDLLSDGDKMRRVMEVYTWLKEGRDLQEQKLIDIMDESDRREFTDILSQQLDDAFEMRGRESLLDLELVKERQRNEKKIKALEDKYRDKISELRSKAENKIKNSAEKKKIEVKQERYKFKSLSEAVSKYGRIKEGEKPYRETAVPRKIDKDRYVSRFARTMVEAGVTPNEALSEFEERILSGDMTYERITDEKAKNYAEEKIKRRGFLKSLEDWDEMILSNQRIGKNEMAFGQMLYNQCINAKDAKHAMKIAADLANIATQAGQTVQACQLLKQMSPDCQLYSLEQSVSKMEDEFRQQLKLLSGKNRDIDIKINESFAQEYLNAETQEERDIAMDKLLEDIAGQIPSSLKDKWDSWRYLSMLGNPRTHIRNIGGNLVFMLPVHLKNTLSYIAEKAIPKGQRTKSYIKTAESKEFAKRDYIKMKDIIQGNSGKFEGISKINELRRIYKFKPLEGLRKANFAALEWEDGIFLKHHYENALAQIMTARGYTAEFLNSGTSEARAALEAARAYAINEAQKATYRDANAAAEAISSAQRKLQNSKYFAGRAAGLALEGVVPFKKTPLNIVKRGIEYSPVGLINGVYDMAFNIKSGKTTAAEAIDKLASGLVGTALTVLGMWLASIGLVRGDGDDDKNAERLDNATGEQSYSVRIGKHSYTIDWVAPASMPFFVGVNIQKAFASDKKFTFEDIVKALVKIPDPIMSLSVLSSLSDLLSAGNYADTGAEKAAAYAWQTATSYVGQAYPTMFGQIARTIDKAKRNTYYADTENGIPDGLERFINRQLAKTPGASRLIEPKIDMWGREETYGDTWYGRFVGNTLSPGYYKEIDSTALDDELRRLYEEYEGDGSVLPPKIPKYFTYEKQKYYMNPSEYTKYSVIRGQKSFEAADELIRTDDYKNKSAEEKKRALEKCYDAAGDEARNEILKGRGVDVAEKEAEKEQSKKKSKSKSSNKRFR